MLIKAYGSAVHGISATTITIEESITYGIRFFIVGLADNAVILTCHNIALHLVPPYDF